MRFPLDHWKVECSQGQAPCFVELSKKSLMNGTKQNQILQYSRGPHQKIGGKMTLESILQQKWCLLRFLQSQSDPSGCKRDLAAHFDKLLEPKIQNDSPTTYWVSLYEDLGKFLVSGTHLPLVPQPVDANAGRRENPSAFYTIPLQPAPLRALLGRPRASEPSGFSPPPFVISHFSESSLLMLYLALRNRQAHKKMGNSLDRLIDLAKYHRIIGCR